MTTAARQSAVATAEVPAGETGPAGGGVGGHDAGPCDTLSVGPHRFNEAEDGPRARGNWRRHMVACRVDVTARNKLVEQGCKITACRIGSELRESNAQKLTSIERVAS